ncbi:MAG TPA: hypothetical protein VGR56_02725 [Nitrososphaerales archaeon]|nr:hypothetical protein [Nitrososphaerales archaeon]
MTLEYVEPPYNGHGCKCGAHSQHRLLRFLFENRGATLRTAAEELHLSYPNVRMISTRLKRRPDRGRLCPMCFAPDFFSASCHTCGFTIDGSPPTTTVIDPEASSPVHRILPDRGLGGYVSRANYASLARKMYHGENLSHAQLKRHAANLSHLAEPKGDRLMSSVLSKLLEELKRTYPDDSVSEVAARLAAEEVKAFRTNYPSLTAPKGLGDQLVRNVLHRIEILYPHFRRQAQQRNDATSVLSGEEA